MAGITVVGLDQAGGACAGTRTGWYRVDGAGVTLKGDPVAGHGNGVHAGPVMVEGLDWYKVGGEAIVVAGCAASCGHVATGRTWYDLAGPG